MSCRSQDVTSCFLVHARCLFPLHQQLSLLAMYTMQHLVAPSVDVDSANQTFYMVSVDHSLVCRSHGYPTPTVYWLWQPCSTAACTAPRRSLWTSVSGSKNIVQVRHDTQFFLFLCLRLPKRIICAARPKKIR